jgi:hypothetical protein
MKLSAGLQEMSTMFKIGTKGKEIGVSRNFFNVEVKCCLRKTNIVFWECRTTILDFGESL